MIIIVGMYIFSSIDKHLHYCHMKEDLILEQVEKAVFFLAHFIAWNGIVGANVCKGVLGGLNALVGGGG